MEVKRLTLFAGHYGSGKTNIAINYAVWLKQQGLPVTIADLDIVNPYFRVQDSEKLLRETGIPLIVSEYAGTNLDAPAMPKEAYGLVTDTEMYGVIDVGGDDRGALALGRYVPDILEENDYEMLLVANKARPLTRTVEDTIQVMREIEEACGLPFTGLINNTNLGPDTTVQDVLDSVQYIEDLSRSTGLPVKMTCVRKDLAPQLAEQIDAVFPIDLQKLYYMMEE
ncbi:MAG: hypothetical protein K6A77_00010 [Clostridiales bacterium]|nr:hypothetical protein [Clostridiales bacterium]